MKGPLRLLRILARPNLGGPARQCALLAEILPGLSVRQLLVTGRTGPFESRFPLKGRSLAPGEAEHLGTGAEGLVSLDSLGGGRLDPGADLLSLRALLRLVRSFRPQVLHTHTTQAGWLGGLAARLTRTPLVHSFHGHVLEGYFPRPLELCLRGIERRLSRWRSRFHCVSRSCEAELQKLGVVEEGRTEVIPPLCEAPRNGPSRQELRARLGLGPGDLALLWAGRMEPVKDPLLLPAVLGRLEARLRGRGLRCFCFGGGSLRERLGREARGLPLHLKAPDPELPALLPAFDLLLMTSRREGLPLIALEALLRGVPLVGPRVPGLVDLQGPGVRLVPSREAGALAAACLEPIRVPEERRRELAEAHDPRRLAGEYREMYRKLLASHAADRDPFRG